MKNKRESGIESWEAFWSVTLFLFMVVSLVLGYIYYNQSTKEVNCWDQYTTEEQAILHCEGENK